MKIVLASHNPGKVVEFNSLFKDFDIELIPQSALGVSEIEETGLSFIENALLKARHAAKITGLPALSDDSGLAVDVLHGAPGIYSARYAGNQADANANITKLLHELTDVPDEKRQATFHCILAFMLHHQDPTPLICEGKWSGKILLAPQGEQGFGYDPIFFVPAENKSAAELAPAIKNKISHRGQALQLLINRLAEKIT